MNLKFQTSNFKINPKSKIQKWKKVGVLMGGLSKEREISLKTGTAILGALQRKGYDAVSIDAGENLIDQIRSSKIEVAFIALHGSLGEDGCVQGLLEWMEIPYTGSGVLASSLSMDKAVLNRVSRDLEFLVPQESIFDARFEKPDDFVRRYRKPWPAIVKPSREGSTINVTIVKEAGELKAAIEKALQSDTKVLIEEFIQGKEVTVSVLNGRVLPSIEIVPKSGFYDYRSKYTKGMTEYILPARVSQRCLDKLAHISLGIYQTIDCSGVIRADFIVSADKDDQPRSGERGRLHPALPAEGATQAPMIGKPYFLEVNTIPGMTETSLVPKAAAHAGISFEDLCEMILDGAGLKVRR